MEYPTRRTILVPPTNLELTHDQCTAIGRNRRIVKRVYGVSNWGLCSKFVKTYEGHKGYQQLIRGIPVTVDSRFAMAITELQRHELSELIAIKGICTIYPCGRGIIVGPKEEDRYLIESWAVLHTFMQMADHEWKPRWVKCAIPVEDKNTN